MKTAYLTTTIYCAILMLSCTSKPTSSAVDGEQRSTNDVFEQEPKTLLSRHDTLILNESYRVEIYDNGELFVLNQQDSVLLTTSAEGVHNSQFIDFDEDGYLDIRLNLVTNVPNISNLALFNPTTKTFELVKDFGFFPAAKKIKGSPFYYSYSRSGCADFDWESELFLMQHYEITTLGKMIGTGCEDHAFTGIKIYKCNADYDSLVKTISRKAGYDKSRFDFMESYWKGNFELFKQPEGLHHY